MARPQKEGLDYFPLDVNMDQDDKVIVITAKYGMQGFGVLIKLLMEIYRNGYYYHWTEKEHLIFSSRVSVDINTVKELVSDCIKWGLFNEKIYNEHHILTSKGIQERYLLATSRRVNVDIKEELRLVSVDINHNSTKKVSVKSTQSKVKEKKVNKTKEKDKNIPEQIENLRQRYSTNQLEIIDKYLDMIRHTRVSAKISDSVVLGMYKVWDKYPVICVEYGLKTHVENPAYHSRKENYTMGIIRNTTADEAFSKLNNTKHKKTDFDDYIDSL